MKELEPQSVDEVESVSDSEMLKTQTTTHQHSYGVVVFALVAGIIGGMYGSLDLAKRPFFQNMFGGRNSTANLEQSVKINEESAITDVVESAGGAVVSIVISREVNEPGGLFFGPFGIFNVPDKSSGVQEVGAGTGFFVTQDGWIMTNRHVVNDETAKYSVLTNDGHSYDATVVAKDPTNDIALLKIDIKDAPYLRFADSDSLKLGQNVIAIGNSLGQYQNTVTRGIISGIGRSIAAGGGGVVEQLDGMIQTDAAINRGNSGGPLLSITGLVVGINTAIDVSGQSIGFAIPANDARSALEIYQQTGKIVRPYLGVRYTMITKGVAQANNLPKDYGAWLIPGVRSTDFAVIPNSPAARAGLKANDIILELNGERLDTNNSLARALKKFRPNDRVEAKVFRDGSEIMITIMIGETEL
jgi:serine protease Do